jgi:5-dehydro-2-deoxygluconokinase
MEAIYAAGIRPDWWKLPPSVQPAAWQRIDAAIDRHDSLCRGVLVLGMEADAAALGAGFAAAARSTWVRGFAVGRSIWAAAASDWFAGRWDDARAIDDVARKYSEVIGLWHQKENA